MKLRSALRTPYRSRTIVRSSAPEEVDAIRLGRAAVWTQLVLLALCAARVAADRIRGPLTLEGHFALVLLVAFAASLTAKAIGWAAGASDGRAS